MCIYLLNKTHQNVKREKYVCSVLLVKCLHVQRKVIIDGYNRLRYLISANIYIYIYSRRVVFPFRHIFTYGFKRVNARV